MEDQYIVIEVPHQRPVRARTFGSEVCANGFYIHRAVAFDFDKWAREQHGVADPWADLTDAKRTALIWEFFAHDLHALHRWTLEEAREKLAWLDKPNGGQQKMHQHRAIAVALAEFSLAAFRPDVSVNHFQGGYPQRFWVPEITLTIGEDRRSETADVLDHGYGAFADVEGFRSLELLHGDWLRHAIVEAIDESRELAARG